MNVKQLLYLTLMILITTSCKPQLVGESYDPPGSTNTKDKKISYQSKKLYTYDSVFFDNQFLGARLNEVVKDSADAYTASILPENAPINSSPWYAFKIWSDTVKTIKVTLAYRHAKHRYYPKLSSNGKDWEKLERKNIEKLNDSTVVLTLEVKPDTLWVSAQELRTSKEIGEWSATLQEKKYVRSQTIGESQDGRPIEMITITENQRSKNYFIILCRQHPPEITGQLAMEHFIAKMTGDSDLAKEFRSKFQILVFPLVNPDGVDNGHWRHSAAGIDLNRDWVNFNQEETSAVAKFLKKRIKGNDKVWFALDFHSTQTDVLYTIIDEVVPRSESLVQPWLDAVRKRMPEDRWYEEPFDIQSPISKNWIYKTFNAEAITYEIGDEVNRDYLKKKSNVAVEEMMKMLLVKETAYRNNRR